MWNTLDEAVKALGTEKALNWLNQMSGNKDYRKVYNATKQEVTKQARTDPRYKQLLAEAKAKVEAKLARTAPKTDEPRLVKKA
jgi:hypothetical protein